MYSSGYNRYSVPGAYGGSAQRGGAQYDMPPANYGRYQDEEQKESSEKAWRTQFHLVLFLQG